MPEQRRYARDPEKHRAISRKSYHAHRSEINKRRTERYHLERAAKGIIVDSGTASRMGAMREAPRHVLEQLWTNNLFVKINAIIAENVGSRHTRKNLRCAVRVILTRAEKDGLAEEREITPAWLAGFPRQTKDRRKEPIYRANFARMLLRLHLWSQEDYTLFRQNAEVSFGRWKNHIRRLDAPKPKPAPAPPDELCQLVRELADRCGLSTAQMRELRVTYIQPDGLRMPPKPKSEKPGRLVPKLGRFIPFGNGWDELRKTILDAYIRNEKPTDYLFFSRSPRDKKKPLSKMTLNGAVIASRTTIKGFCNQHFDEDFKRARSLQQARFHLRNVHHLDNQHVHHMIAGSRWWKGHANEADTIPIPKPYLLATMCASRSVAEDRAESHIPETGGGKRHLITWHDLFGYEITVDWTRRFAKELGGRGQKSAKALRLLCRLAFDFWFAGRRMKLPDIEDSEIRPEDKDLLQEFAVTRVIVRHPRASWAGSLFEFDTRKRSFRIPLIEQMHRRAWHNQCMVCWHPERDNIEREISEAATKEGRKKGYSLIASKYGVSNVSLAGHRGRKSPAPGRGETQRSHFSTGSIAPIVCCPRSFFEQLHKLSATDLMIYSLVLLELHRADPPELIVSTELVKQRLDLRLDESQLSVALNHLGSTGASLISFRRDPKGFYTQLC